MFEASGTLPQAQDGDAWILRQVLHDWDDQHATCILRSLRAAIGSTDAVVLIVEVCRPLTLLLVPAHDGVFP